MMFGLMDTRLMTSEESTTPDLTELVRSLYAVTDRDFDWEAVRDFFAPDAVFDLATFGLGTYAGLDTIGAFLREYWATWEEHHHYVEEVVEFGNGLTVVSMHEDGRLVGSDSRIEAQNGWVYEWVAGKIARGVPYRSFDEARAAAERLVEERSRACPEP